jgi:hypothetical protein
MIEGYVVDGRSTYCSDECLHRHISEKNSRPFTTMATATPTGPHGMRNRRGIYNA